MIMLPFGCELLSIFVILIQLYSSVTFVNDWSYVVNCSQSL